MYQISGAKKKKLIWNMVYVLDPLCVINVIWNGTYFYAPLTFNMHQGEERD